MFAIILFIFSEAHSEFSKVQKNDVLKLTKSNRTARENPQNFNRNFTSNHALGKNSYLPAGAKVRYTGKYSKTKKGNYGIQVEILSGEGLEKYKGKLVWIYYRNNEWTIKKTNEAVSPLRPINPADITEEEDLIKPDREDPSEFFDTKTHQFQVEPEQAADYLNKLQKTINRSGTVSSDVPCTSTSCAGDISEASDANRSNLDSNDSLNAELNELNLSESARSALMQSSIPSIPLLRALHFYNTNKNIRHLQNDYLVVSDLTQPSNKKRMYQINLKTGQVSKFTTSHGSGYSNAYDCVNTFGNKETRQGTKLSAGGGYVTGNLRKFQGYRALHLYGVEEGKNDNSHSRKILFHRASYVNDSQAGRTAGCISIAKKYADQFINDLFGTGVDSVEGEGGSAIYVYPDRDDILNKNSYWDASCKSKLAKRGRSPRWIP